MLRSIILAALLWAGFGSAAALAEWQYEAKVDPFTDKPVSSRVTGWASEGDEVYQIVYECQGSATVLTFALPPPGAPQGALKVQFRVGKNPPHKTIWQQVSARSRGFYIKPEDWQAILTEGDPSDDLVVSPDTYFAAMRGEPTILRFDMRGLRIGAEKVASDCRNKR